MWDDFEVDLSDCCGVGQGEFEGRSPLLRPLSIVSVNGSCDAGCFDRWRRVDKLGQRG